METTETRPLGGNLPMPRRADRCRAFTLIELMVAVAIIALLIGILIPTFGAVGDNARKVATAATFGVLDRGLESYRGEDSLGGGYPPSRTDNDAGAITSVLIMNDPFDPGGGREVTLATGANLLVYGLAGADQLGTPGFLDTNGDGFWWNDQRSNPGGAGAYEMNLTTFEPVKPRYPSTGATYVDEPTKAGIRTLQQLADEGIMASDTDPLENSNVLHQPFFTDAWGRPILYYRANRGARIMITEVGGGPVGVYDHRDNALMTGAFFGPPGIDFGPGQVDTIFFKFSKIGFTNMPGPDPTLNIPTSNGFDNTFERFIQDTSVTQRNEPVNRNTYLLISAGPDAVYGTSDDVVNWTRE